MTQTREGDREQLIDFVLGQCEPDVASAVRRRLVDDEEFRKAHQDVARALSALSLAGPVETPQDLVGRTLARIRQHEQTDALLARERLARPARRPTFRLRELIAVAAVLLIMFGAFTLWRRQARREYLVSLCRSQMGQMGTGLRTYANAHGGLLPAADETRHRWLARPGEAAASNSSGLFKLVVSDVVPASVFRCPGVTGRAMSQAGFSVRPEMTDFPTAGHINYSYQHTLGGRTLSQHKLAKVARSMAILADSNPVFSGGRFRRDRLDDEASDNHDNAGQNVLYLDMHVAWATEPTVGVKVGREGNNIFLAEGVREYDGDERPADDADTFLLPAYSGP